MVYAKSMSPKYKIFVASFWSEILNKSLEHLFSFLLYFSISEIHLFMLKSSNQQDCYFFCVFFFNSSCNVLWCFCCCWFPGDADIVHQICPSVYPTNCPSVCLLKLCFLLLCFFRIIYEIVFQYIKLNVMNLREDLFVGLFVMKLLL